MTMPNADELAAALAEIEPLRNALKLAVDVTDRLRADVVELAEVNAAQQERIDRLEVIIRGRS